MTAMKYLFIFLALFISSPSFAECVWSNPSLIPNEDKLHFQECKADKKIKIGQIEITPNIDFNIIHEYWPEGNTIWSTHSPDSKTAVIYIENNNYERNAWVINTLTNTVELFTDHSEGKHFQVKFVDNGHFVITHAGMGYRTDYHYENISDTWKNTHHEKVDVQW